MIFTSVQEIVNRFKINSTSYSEILIEIKERRNKLHPDKNGGSFFTKDDEAEFLNLNEAIEWLTNNNNQLIPFNQIYDLVKVITSLEKANNIKLEVEERKNQLSKTLDSTKLLVSKRLQFPKIAVSVVAGIISFLWLFPKQISEHPILGKLIDINGLTFKYAWLISIGSAIYLWVYSYIQDLKQQNITKSIESDTYQNDIFKVFLIDNLKRKEEFFLSDNFLVFSKSEFINFILSELKPRKKKPIDLLFAFYTIGLYTIKPRIDTDIVENLANLIIKKNLDKGTISKDEYISLDDIYRTNISKREFDILKSI